MEAASKANGIEVYGPVSEAFRRILTPEAIRFVGVLASEFEPRRKELLERRKAVQRAIDSGKFPDFLPETRHIRDGDWKVAPVPADLQDRRVEITGPVDRKMVINALNSGASTYMADFEDSHSPTWEATIEGQINLIDAVKGTIEFVSPEGKQYRLGDKTAVLIVRPRGWHLVEKHVRVDGQPISAGIFDFGLFFFHNAKTLISKGTGPYFYLPKMESHLEARLWNDIFVRAQQQLNIPVGTIKATVLIETILAAFETDEILYELRDHMAGLNCGRWDYIFSFIKKFKNQPDYIFPDRAQITMTRHCMRSYSLLVIQTCHRRGAHAIGGMAAQIPIKEDPDQNAAALGKVREDKIREATDGHDGTWVAHPGLVHIALEEFDKAMPAPNQVSKLREDVTVTAKDLLKLPEGTITEEGLRTNVSVGVQYMASWLNGNGCVPLYNLMEDAATAEISRTQVWQWVHHPKGILADGRKVTLELFRQVMAEEMDKIRKAVGEERFVAGKYALAAQLFEEIIAGDTLEEFLTLRAYEYLD
jgi:malate synthase